MGDDDNEAYILLLLSDSNLPTGSFVASSGLESYCKHGLDSSLPSVEDRVVNFVRNSIASYGRSALPFVSDAHIIVEGFASVQGSIENINIDDWEGRTNDTLHKLSELDKLYQVMTLNDVSRRASASQGVALLTLYSKGFSRPRSLSTLSGPEYSRVCEGRMHHLLDEFKLKIRKEETFGHLPICWGALTAALGLNLERAQYLHLFLHARGILSASVRLNNLGPYGAQQVLLHDVRPLLAAELERCRGIRTGVFQSPEDRFDEVKMGPANTWPLGEILAGLHDRQHSRIFNS